MQVTEVKNLRELLPHKPRLLVEMRRRDDLIELLPPNPEREIRRSQTPGYGKALVCEENGMFRGLMLLRELRWESKIFSLKMGIVRTTLGADDGPAGSEATAAMIGAGAVAFDYLLVPVVEGEESPADCGPGAERVELTGMVNLRRSLDALPAPPPPANVKIRAIAGSDVRAIQDIVAMAFVHDRYTVDPSLPRDRVEKAHRDWAAECCDFCDLVLVAECDKVVVGFCAVSPGAGRTGIVQLIAVDAPRLREGIGASLLGASLERLGGRADRVVIRTERTNTPALGLYSKMGFKPYARFEYLRYRKT